MGPFLAGCKLINYRIYSPIGHPSRWVPPTVQWSFHELHIGLSPVALCLNAVGPTGNSLGNFLSEIIHVSQEETFVITSAFVFFTTLQCCKICLNLNYSFNPLRAIWHMSKQGFSILFDLLLLWGQSPDTVLSQLAFALVSLSGTGF